MLVAEEQFRRIIGYRHLASLVMALERHAATAHSERQEVKELVTA